MQKGKHSQVEKGLYLWHKYVKGKDLPVSGPLLNENLEFEKQIEGEGSDFIASDIWFGPL